MHDPFCQRPGNACLAGAGLGLLALVFATAAAAAADEVAVASSPDALRDLQLVIHARKALHEDSELASVNFRVRVRDGVATLWGPVPTADLIAKASKCLESVQGILGVRSELFVAPPEKEFEPLPIPVSPSEPTRSESASPDPVRGLLSALTGRNLSISAAPSSPPPASSSSGVELAPPEPVSGSDPVPAVTPPPARAPVKTAANTENLAASVKRLQGGDSRFRGLRVEIQGSVIVIAGPAERDSDIMFFARAVARLNGVGRVLTRTEAATVP